MPLAFLVVAGILVGLIVFGRATAVPATLWRGRSGITLAIIGMALVTMAIVILMAAITS